MLTATQHVELHSTVVLLNPISFRFPDLILILDPTIQNGRSSYIDGYIDYIVVSHYIKIKKSHANVAYQD